MCICKCNSLLNAPVHFLNDDANENNAARNKINKSKTIISKSFEYETNLIGSTLNNNNILDVEVVVPLKYLRNLIKRMYNI